MSILALRFGLSLPVLFAMAAAAGIVALVYAYLRRGKARRIFVASTIFIRLLESMPKARQKCFPPWRFFLEMLLVLLLSAAAAGLYLRGGGASYIVILDNSASMQARIDSGSAKSLFALAQEKVSGEINSAKWGSRFNVYLTSPRLTSVSEGFTDKLSAASLVEGAEPSLIRDNLQAALEELLASEKSARFIVATDKSLEASSGRPDIRWINLKSYAEKQRFDNIALSDLAFIQTGIGEASPSLSVKVKSYSGAARDVIVRVATCESVSECRSPQLLSRQKVSLPAGEVAESLFSINSNQNGALYISLQEVSGSSLSDDFEADNSAYISTQSQKTKVLLVSNLDAGRLGLKAIPTLQADHLTPSEYESLSRAGGLTLYSSIIFHRYAPSDLPPANIVFILPPSNKIFAVGKEREGTLVSRWKTGHPLISYLNLAALKLPIVTPLVKPSVAEEIISTPFGTALFAGEMQGRRLAAFGFEMLPYEGKRSPLLSILTLNTLKWVSQISAEVGYQRLDNPVMAGPQLRSIKHSKLGELSSATAPGRAIFIPEPGLVEIQQEGKTFQQAFRFYNSDESNLNELQKVSLVESTASSSLAKQEENDLIIKLVLIAFLLLLFDYMVGLLKPAFRSARRGQQSGY